jgi:hypothetical protein
MPAQGSFSTTSGGQTALNSGSTIGHDASAFKTSISMLIHAPCEQPAQLQIAVFKTDGTFYKGSR